MFNRTKYEKFASLLRIDSKEFGNVPLRQRYLGTQKYFIDEIQDGLEHGIHKFIVLKARQLGISTESWALDLFWQFEHRGLRGTLVTHDEETREECRANLTSYMDSLPPSHKVPIAVHNRTMLAFENRSRFSYQVAGTRKNGKLGRGKGLNFCHATEVSSYGDEEAVDSLIDSLAETFPDRLYIFESTARGFNIFYDMWAEAENSKTEKRIFIGWWRNELYRVEKDSDIFATYGFEDPTQEEFEWIDQVKRLYGFEIQPEQLAWARWKLYEGHRGNDTIFYQEFPPLPDYAFQMSGSKFFSNRKLTETKLQLEVEQIPAEYYRYNFGPIFDQTVLSVCAPFQAQLTVWEEPDPLGTYVIAGDPAYGVSTTSDRFCIQVVKCFSDGIEQVAEFCTTDCLAYAFAWVMAHLCGAYRDSMPILDINGPGRAVWDELVRIQQTGGYNSAKDVKPGLLDVVGNVRNYLYHRSDSLSGNFAYQFQTTQALKESYMNKYRDVYERGILKIRSLDLLEEMKSIVNDEGVIEAGSARQKDDRAIAMGLAIQAYQDHILPDLYERGWTRASWFAEHTRLETNGSILQSRLANFLQQFQ